MNMDSQKFDASLKSALQDLELPYDAGTWAALEARLDALPAPDAIDQIVKPGLERVELPFEPSAWDKLAHKMDQKVLVQRIRKTKALELAIFLLLLTNLNGFFGVVDSVSKPRTKPGQTTQPIAGIKSVKKSPGSSFSKINTNDSEGGGLLDNLLKLAHQGSEVSPTTMVVEPNGSNHQVALENSAHDERSLLDPSRFYSQSGPIHFVDPTLMLVNKPKPILYATVRPDFHGFDAAKKSKKRHIYLASFANFDKNTVRESQHTNRSSNLGAGLALGYRKGKWGVETGLVYAQIDYQPKRQNVEYQNDPFTGISFYYVDEVQADVFTIPVKATRRLTKLGRTSAHIVAGVSAHLATSKAYSHETLHLPPPVPVTNPNPAPPPSPNFPEGKGLLQNGGINRNLYASADLGIRVEHPIGKRYVAFVEPAYRQSLGESFGPATARINSFSLQAGVMAHL